MEDKEYLSIDEAAAYLRWNRATVYNRMKDLGITAHKFKYDRRAYLAQADVQRLRELKEKPWLGGEKREDKDVA